MEINHAFDVIQKNLNDIDEYTQCPFPDYVRNNRLEVAKNLLVQRMDLSIVEICEKVGYSNTSYFTTSFKKKYGVTPSKYRLNLKINE